MYKIECVTSFPDFMFRRVPNTYNKVSVEVQYVEAVAIDGDCHVFSLVGIIWVCSLDFCRVNLSVGSSTACITKPEILHS